MTGLVVRVFKDRDRDGRPEYLKAAAAIMIAKDINSDGTLDVQRTNGKWVKRTDVKDDGTEINEQSGTWTDES